MVNGNDVIHPWIIFRGGQIDVERSKILECDRIMKVFFVERNKYYFLIIYKVLFPC